MSVSGLIDGMVTALMKMHIGDRWKVYIPYQLGYGTTTSSSTSIPGYSTLIFDLTLSSYYRMDTTVPDDQAKPFTGWVDD
jgi:FKBP-type peptidyl-prolyl cis-trans isomerase FklB